MPRDIDELLEQELLSGDYDDEEEGLEGLGYSTIERPQIGSTQRRHGPGRNAPGRMRGSNVPSNQLPRLFCGIKPRTIMPGKSETIQIQVTNPFRPDRFILDPSSQGLLVEDIKISRVSQNTGDGPVPGSAFSPDSVGANLRGDTAQTGVGIELTVSNPGTVANEDPPIILRGAFFGPAA